MSDRLVDQAGLAHARFAEHGRELRPPIPDRPAIRELEQGELVLPADMRRARFTPLFAVEAEQTEALHPRLEPLQLERAGRLRSHQMPHEPMGGGGKQDLAVAGLGLQPGCEVGRTSEHRRTAAGEDLAGRNPRADLEAGAPPALELVVHAVER